LPLAIPFPGNAFLDAPEGSSPIYLLSPSTKTISFFSTFVKWGNKQVLNGHGEILIKWCVIH